MVVVVGGGVLVFWVRQQQQEAAEAELAWPCGHVCGGKRGYQNMRNGGGVVF